MLAALLTFVIYVLVLGFIVWLLLYAVDAAGVPEPFHKLARAVIIVAGIIILIWLLLQFIGGAGINLPALK